MGRRRGKWEPLAIGVKDIDQLIDLSTQGPGGSMLKSVLLYMAMLARPRPSRQLMVLEFPAEGDVSVVLYPIKSRVGLCVIRLLAAIGLA